MNPRLIATATLCREIAIPASVFVWIVALCYAGIEQTGATPIDRPPLDITASGLLDQPPPLPFRAFDVPTAASAVLNSPAVDASPVSYEADLIVTASLSDPSDLLLPATKPDRLGALSPDLNDTRPAVGSVEIGECFVADSCVDNYLWALYQRTPKEDTVKTHERRKVTVRKRGRLVTVTKTFTTRMNENFSWKDPKAAEKAGLAMPNYVIGGMDREFKLKLFQLLYLAEEAGLSPGITSGFRDDYRQSIASGLKAADDRSYHGGSLRGGYGHGLAADIVSVNGATRAKRMASSEALWNWVDAHGKEFGIGRPYLNRDPPHVAPIDGKEYAAHFPGANAGKVRTAARASSRLASRHVRSPARQVRSAAKITRLARS